MYYSHACICNTGSSDKECHHEIWDTLDNCSDTSDNDDAAPKLPAVSTTNTDEEIKTKAIIGWITGFILSLQARYYISYAAMNLLIKFFQFY